MTGAARRPIGVALLVESLRSGGAERQLTELATRLDRDRFAPRVLVWQENDFYGGALRETGIEVIGYRRRGKLDPVPTVRVARWLRSGEVRIAHGFDDTGNLYAALGRWMAGRGVAIAAERSEERLLGGLSGLHKGWGHRHATVTVANSHSGAAFVTKTAGPRARVVVIPNGVDLQRFRPGDPGERERARRRLGWPLEPRVLLTVGTVRRVKNHLGLAMALERLESLDGWEARWIGVRDPDYAEMVERYLRRPRLSSVVHLHDPIPNIEDAYLASDVVVLSSQHEGTPNVVLEAMASGRPVVATAVGDAPRYVEDGVTGWLAPSPDPASICRALSAAIRCTAEELTAMGEKGRLRMEELGMDVETLVRRHEELYERLLVGAW
ncbi:MAG: glycosyltransferase [Actinomycetota bacterium]|nr:glycosyltransferase [Actinomycetota bacterium]